MAHKFVRQGFGVVGAQNEKAFLTFLELHDGQQNLDARGGNHIVIVGYAWHDTAWIDWAYNEADMDSSKIIWARDMGYLKNKELLDSYPNRQAWYVDRDDIFSLIVPYEQAMAGWKLALSPELFALPSQGVNQPAGRNVTPRQASGLRSVSLSRIDRSHH